MVQSASAGRDAKEDLVVDLVRTPGAGIRVTVTSSVDTLYGAQIRELVQRTVDLLRLQDVSVGVRDQGALDWVITARVEAAARRLGGVAEDVLPALLPGNSYSVERDRMRRSRLYLPGNQPDLMLNAGLFGPDAVILDLEDAVAPAQKDAARLLVRNALRAVDFCGAERMVRINQLPAGLDDLPVLLPHNVHTILLPKAERAADVLAVVARAREITDRPVFLMPILESALGIENAYAIASADPAVVALAFGAEDFTRDIGASRTEAGMESFVARSRVVLAARAAGVQPIDTVYSDVANDAGLLAATREAIGLGFDGKGCIHPRQVQVIHDAFRPTREEIANAYRIQQAMEAAAHRGDGVVAMGSKMIDPPVVARALRVLRLAEFYTLDPAKIAAEASR
jgi:citrate lyase subunit beta / citryl-CoA lyase